MLRLINRVVIGGVLVAGVALVAWIVTDGFYFGDRPYHSCTGDPATCAAAAQYVIEQWPAVAPWDDPHDLQRIGDVSWIECDYIDSDVTTCYAVMVFDGSHYGDPVHVHFPEGYSRDGRAKGDRIEVLTDQ